MEKFLTKSKKAVDLGLELVESGNQEAAEILGTDCYRNAFFPMFAKYLSRETGIPVGILYNRWTS